MMTPGGIREFWERHDSSEEEPLFPPSFTQENLRKGTTQTPQQPSVAAMSSLHKKPPVEAIEGKTSLPDEREDVFDIFNHFIYGRVIADEKEYELPWDILVAIWLFGDKYLVPSLQNSAMDTLMVKYRVEKVAPTSQISIIWEKTLPSSPLRRFLLDLIVYKRNLSKRKLNKDKWTHEALMDLVMTYANKEDVKKWHLPVYGKCHFHIHKEGEEC